MIKAYTYKLTHKTTGRFYLGSRCANKVPASADLGVKYFSSNKKIAQSFAEYNAVILEEFDCGDDAWYSEQSLIEASWGNPLLLNHHFQRTRSSFSMAGAKRVDLAALNTKLKTKPREERTYICGYCRQYFKAVELVHHARRENPFCSQKCSGSAALTKAANQARGKPNLATKGKPAWNRGLPNPKAAENGKKSAIKLSQTTTGRKMALVDGKRVWSYKDEKGWYIKTDGVKFYLRLFKVLEVHLV